MASGTLLRPLHHGEQSTQEIANIIVIFVQGHVEILLSRQLDSPTTGSSHQASLQDRGASISDIYLQFFLPNEAVVRPHS